MAYIPEDVRRGMDTMKNTFGEESQQYKEAQALIQGIENMPYGERKGGLGVPVQYSDMARAERDSQQIRDYIDRAKKMQEYNDAQVAIRKTGHETYAKEYYKPEGIGDYWQQQQAYYRSLGNNDPVIQSLGQRALGQNSIVERQGLVERQNLANAIAAQSAAAQRGGYNPALARAAMMQQSALGQNMAGQIAAGKAQEMQAAQDAYRQWMAQKENMAASMYGLGLGDKEADRAARMAATNQAMGYSSGQDQMRNQYNIAKMQVDAQNDFTTKDAIGTGLGLVTGGLQAWGSWGKK